MILPCGDSVFSCHVLLELNFSRRNFILYMTSTNTMLPIRLIEHHQSSCFMQQVGNMLGYNSVKHPFLHIWNS